MVAIGSHLSKRKLVRRFLRRLFHKITEAFAPFAGKFPAVLLENGIGAYGEIQVFGIGAHATVDHRSNNSNQISVAADYISASPGAGSHGDQSAIAAAL